MKNETKNNFQLMKAFALFILKASGNTIKMPLPSIIYPFKHLFTVRLNA